MKTAKLATIEGFSALVRLGEFRSPNYFHPVRCIANRSSQTSHRMSKSCFVLDFDVMALISSLCDLCEILDTCFLICDAGVPINCIHMFSFFQNCLRETVEILTTVEIFIPTDETW